MIARTTVKIKAVMPKKGLLERLSDGVVIGDGGFVTLMEKRGYTSIGMWTPEATVEHPEAGRCKDCDRSTVRHQGTRLSNKYWKTVIIV